MPIHTYVMKTRPVEQADNLISFLPFTYLLHLVKNASVGYVLDNLSLLIYIKYIRSLYKVLTQENI